MAAVDGPRQNEWRPMQKIIKQTTDDGICILRLDGEAGVEDLRELHGELLESLKGFSRVHIDCSELKSADYYVLQLLCSAHLASIAWIKEVCFHGKPSGALRNAAASVGLLRRNKCSICPDDVHCLWSEL